MKLRQPAAKKTGVAAKRVAAKRKRLSAEDKVNALDLLRTMSLPVVAARMGTGESTIYAWNKDEKKLRSAAASAKAGAKSTKGGEFRRCVGVYARCFLRACVCFCVRKKKGKLLLSKCRVPVHRCITSMGPKNRVLSAACQTHLVPWDVGGIFIFFMMCWTMR